MNFVIQEDETIEDLQLNGLRLIQKKNGFRFGMDSVLLADFADIRPSDTVVDLGSGNGVLPILLAGRGKGSRYYAVEIQEEAAALAERNAALNQLETRMNVLHCDAGVVQRHFPPCGVDAVICNPPYGRPEATLSSPVPEKAIARSQAVDTLDRFLTGAFLILKGKGKLSLVYPAPQMLYLMNLLQSHHLEPKRFRLVYPYEDKPANLVLVEAVKDAKPTLHPLPPLIIYQKNGDLTNELKSVYHIQEQTEF